MKHIVHIFYVKRKHAKTIDVYIYIHTYICMYYVTISLGKAFVNM